MVANNTTFDTSQVINYRIAQDFNLAVENFGRFGS